MVKKMKMHKISIHIKTLYMLFGLFIGLIGIICVNNPTVHLLIIWGEVIFAASLVKFDLVHPFFWFSVIFALYNTAYTICYVFEYDRTAGYSSMNSLYCIIALGIVLVIVGAEKIERNTQFTEYLDINTYLNNRFFYFFAILSAVSAIILGMRGYAGKSEMAQEGDVFFRIGIVIIRWMIVLMVILMCNYECGDNKKNFKYISVSMVASLMLGLFTGDRDIIFRAGVLIVIILFYYNKIKPKHLILLIPVAIVGVIASVYFKYRFLRGVGNTMYLSSGNGLYLFLTSDFSAAGRNAQYLLNNNWTNGYFGIRLFFSELLRGLIPGVSFINPSEWYNYNVYPGLFKGQAFTLVGFGHVIGGIWGVIFVFIILGIFIRIVYHRSRKNIYTLSYYLFSISIVMGCFRQTFNTIVNTSIKSAMIAILLSVFLARVKPSKTVDLRDYK